MLVEGDRFFDFLAEGAVAPWLPEAHRQNDVVTQAAAAATGRFALGYDTVYDGVVGPWLLPAFSRATGLSEFDYVILLPGVDTCVARVRTRTGHRFTDEEATRKMHREFGTAKVGQRHVIRNETLGPETTAAAITSARSTGLLRLTVGHDGS